MADEAVREAVRADEAARAERVAKSNWTDFGLSHLNFVAVDAFKFCCILFLVRTGVQCILVFLVRTGVQCIVSYVVSYLGSFFADYPGTSQALAEASAAIGAGSVVVFASYYFGPAGFIFLRNKFHRRYQRVHQGGGREVNLDHGGGRGA